jgi:RNA polymerase sigma factor (sigma-70 family)
MADNPGDRSFERLYRRHARDVYRFVLAIVRNPAEAEDVTQTAFLNAYRAFKRGERPERPRSWLIAIAHNTIRSRHRFRLRRPKEVPFDERLLDLPVAAEERETVAEVLEALGELPVNQREALAMRELEGRSYPEIAETLGVSVPAVESLIFRARRTLRAQRTSLRGLTVVQLPRSLRTLFQTQPDAVSAGLAAKAAVVVAAASVVAGGMLGSGEAGASQDPAAAGRPEPSRPHLQMIQQPAASRAAVVFHRTAARAQPAPVKAGQRPAHPAAPSALPPPPGVAAPPVTAANGAARPEQPPAAEPDGAAAPSPPASTVPSAASTAVTAATDTVPVPVPVPPVPVPPVPTPPAVTVPTAPSVPDVTPPPLPSLPQPPGTPQVPGLSGIK